MPVADVTVCAGRVKMAQGVHRVVVSLLEPVRALVPKSGIDYAHIWV